MSDADDFSEWEKVIPTVTRDYAYVSASCNVTGKGRHLRISIVAELISQLEWAKVGMVQCFTKYDDKRQQRIMAFVPATPVDAEGKAMCFPLQDAIKGSRKILLHDLPFVPGEKIAKTSCAHRREAVAKHQLIVELSRVFNLPAVSESANGQSEDMQPVARKPVAKPVVKETDAPATGKSELHSRSNLVETLLKKVRLLHAAPHIAGGKLHVTNGRNVKLLPIWCEVLHKMITHQEAGFLYNGDEFLDILASCGIPQARAATTQQWLDKMNEKFLGQVKLKVVLDTGFIYLTHE